MADDSPQVDLPSEVKEALRRDAEEKTTSSKEAAKKTKQTTNVDFSGTTASTNTDSVQSLEYPSEVIELPSEGWFYEQNTPLSTGKIDIKYMTAKEEDILTSQNLIKKGIVLDKLLEQLIVTPGIKLGDILVGDKNAIFIAARILAYGKDYNVKFKDPSTGDDVEDVIDLSKLENKDFDFEQHDKGTNLFDFDLPFCKKKVHWKLLTHTDEQTIESELKSLKKFAKNKNETTEVTTRLKYVIQAIDGDSDKSTIKKFVDTQLLARDSLALRNHIRDNSPDIDLTFNFESEDTGYTERMALPLGVDFFYPSARV